MPSPASDVSKGEYQKDVARHSTISYDGDVKVFISWSGNRSKAVATALRDWLPLVLHYCKPWLSDRDIAAGDRWSVEIARQLEDALFGVIVVTPDNLTAPWLLFEAGALSKAFTATAVVPYIVDVEFSDLAGPLAMFQAKRSDKDSTFELVRSINQRAPEQVEDGKLHQLYEVLWPQLESRLANLPATETSRRVARPEREVLEDLVATVRRVEGKVDTRGSRSSMGINVDNIGIPLTLLIEDDFPGLERGSIVRVVTDEDAIEDVATMRGLNSERYGVEWWLTGTKTSRPVLRSAGPNLARLARRGEVTLSLRRQNSAA
jgi:hypothetical protein